MKNLNWHYLQDQLEKATSNWLGKSEVVSKPHVAIVLWLNPEIGTKSEVISTLKPICENIIGKGVLRISCGLVIESINEEIEEEHYKVTITK